MGKADPLALENNLISSLKVQWRGMPEGSFTLERSTSLEEALH